MNTNVYDSLCFLIWLCHYEKTCLDCWGVLLHSSILMATLMATQTLSLCIPHKLLGPPQGRSNCLLRLASEMTCDVTVDHAAGRFLGPIDSSGQAGLWTTLHGIRNSFLQIHISVSVHWKEKGRIVTEDSFPAYFHLCLRRLKLHD